MRDRFLAWLSTLLIVAGVLLPAGHALANSGNGGGGGGGGGGGKPDGSWYVTGSGPTYSGGNTIVTYTIHEDGNAPDLSHWTLSLCDDVPIVSSSPDFKSRGLDGSTGVTGLKWEGMTFTNEMSFTVTYEGLWLEGQQSWITKFGDKNDPTKQRTGSADGISCTEANPDFEISKTVSDDPESAGGESVTLESGGTAYYTYTITNKGNVPLTISEAVDDRIGSVAPSSFDPNPIPVGESATATASKTFPELEPGDDPISEENTLTVKVKWETITLGPKTDTATVTVNPPLPQPDFSVTKKVSTTMDPANWLDEVTLTNGGTVYYFYTITNTGHVPLSLDSVEDDRINSLGTGDFAENPSNSNPDDGVLEPGESMTATASKTFSGLAPGSEDQSEVNTVTVYMADDSGEVGPKTDTATVINKPLAALDVEPVCYDEEAGTWSWTVSNPNDMAVDYTWTLGSQSGSGTVPANDSVTFETDTNSETNVLEVWVGEYVHDEASAPDEACPAGNFTVIKKVSTTVNPANWLDEVTLINGGTVYYLYTITNTGDISLSLSSAEDDRIDTLDAADFAEDPEDSYADDGVLEPGESMSATASKTFSGLAPGSEDQIEINEITVYMVDDSQQSYGPKTDTAKVTNKPLAALDVEPVCSDPENMENVWQVYNPNGVDVDFTWTTGSVSGNGTVPAGETVELTTPSMFGDSTVTIWVGDHEHDSATASDQKCGDFSITKTVSTSDDPDSGQESVTLTGGGTVYYFYTLTNTGVLPLLVGESVDDVLGEVDFENPEDPEDYLLDPGETWTATMSKTFPNPSEHEEETNTLTVTMWSVRENRYGPKTDTATVYNNPLSTPTPPSPPEIEELCTYTPSQTRSWTITNPNNDALDYWADLNGDEVEDEGETGTLAGGESVTLDGPAIGALTVTYYFGNQSASVTEESTAPQCSPDEEVTVTGLCSYLPEEVLRWQITNPNPYAVDVTIYFEDEELPHEVVTVPANGSETFTSGSWVDSVRVSAGEAEHTAEANWENCTQPISVTELCTNSSQSLRWRITNPNDHSVEYLVDLDSPQTDGFGSADEGEPAGFLAAGQSVVVTTAAVEVLYFWYATDYSVEVFEMESEGRRCPPPPPDPDPDFTITKTVSTTNDPATGEESVTLQNGGTVYYFYTIESTGDASVTITEASDDILGDLFGEGTLPMTLAPGESVTVTKSKTFPTLTGDDSPQTEVNTVSVTGTDVGTKTDTATVINNPPEPVTDFAITKSVSNVNDPATGRASISLRDGGTAYYFYTVTNTGNTTIEIASAVDDKLGEVDFQPKTLAPGETATATLQKEFDGSIPEETNIVTVTASDGTTIYGPKTDTAQVLVFSEEVEPLGTLTVRVIDVSQWKADDLGMAIPKPIAGVQVMVPGLGSGITDENGEIRFTDIPFGTYSASVSTTDPDFPDQSEVQSAAGSDEVSESEPDGFINLPLEWPPLPAEAAPGSIAGFVCSPRQSGVTVTVTGANGQSQTFEVPYDGVLGKRIRYSFSNLDPGTYTVTYAIPGMDPMTRTVTVNENAETAVPDFELACTGGAFNGTGNSTGWTYYITGAVMVLTGLALRRRVRRKGSEA